MNLYKYKYHEMTSRAWLNLIDQVTPYVDMNLGKHSVR